MHHVISGATENNSLKRCNGQEKAGGVTRITGNFKTYLHSLPIQGDVSVADQIYADNYIAHIANMPSAISSVEEFKQFVVLFRALSPDLFFTVEDQIAEGDKVATRWTATIRNTGELSASEPAGGDIIVAGMSIHKVVDGRLAESWDNWDAMTAFQALGQDMFESLSLNL